MQQHNIDTPTMSRLNREEQEVLTEIWSYFRPWFWLVLLIAVALAIKDEFFRYDPYAPKERNQNIIEQTPHQHWADSDTISRKKYRVPQVVAPTKHTFDDDYDFDDYYDWYEYYHD